MPYQSGSDDDDDLPCEPLLLRLTPRRCREPVGGHSRRHPSDKCRGLELGEYLVTAGFVSMINNGTYY